VRADGPHQPWFPLAAGALALAAACTVGALAGGADGALAAAPVGLAAATGMHQLLTRRQRGRRRALARPFPDAWRSLLERRYGHYRRLPAELRARFEDDARIFLAETRITGIEVEVSDELRLLVAASAITLSIAWPEFEWEAVTEVLLYPQDFGRDWSFDSKDLAGQAHAWGTVILSVPSLRESFAHADDGFHVGLHEFAHLLDMEQGHADGIPGGFPRGREREWMDLVGSEMDRLRRGRSVIDSYGSDEPGEFWAVAVEAFFELPLDLRRHHRRLYEILRDYFRQDPAAWDEARGA
jgi:Mlc titration factor MtfA (ptsG expression regulator)